MSEHLCPYPLVVGTTWRCACTKTYWRLLDAPPWWLSERRVAISRTKAQKLRDGRDPGRGAA